MTELRAETGFGVEHVGIGVQDLFCQADVGRSKADLGYLKWRNGRS
jgi:hypothetical protein